VIAPTPRGGHASGPAGRHDIPDLTFAVTGARPLPHAAVPTVVFRLAIGRSGGGPVRSVTLSTAIRIAVTRRRYEHADRLALAQLFGQPEQWATSMRPLAWAQLTTIVPPFDETTEVDLAVPCTRDPELAITSYFHAVRDGDVPLDFLFSGTVFHTDAQGLLRTAQISWAKEADWALPAELWHTLTERYFGGTAWLRISRDAHDRLSAYRARHAHTDWDDTLDALLAAEQGVTWTR
jgi:hypothetical protein